jgi:CelD/BcsL family acetyltransferase involved in cellulose biosynthesis
VLIKIIDDPAAFAALEAPWRALSAVAAARPFQEFGWAAAWMGTIGRTRGRRPRIITAWDQDKLIGVLPLVARPVKGLRVLEWVGSKVTDYCDALLDPRVAGDQVVRQLWDALWRSGGFDVASFGQVRVDSAIHAFLRAQNPWVETREESLGIPLVCGSGSEWLHQQSAKAKNSISYGLRRMHKLGFSYTVCQAPDSYAAIIDALLQQKRAWYAARGLSDIYGERHGADFLYKLVDAMAASGALHLSAIRSNDAIAACHLGFLRDGVFYYYLPTYDARWSKYSPGTVLRGLLIMSACDLGVRRFDMLLGAHDYKSRYDVTAEPVRTLVVPRGPVGRAAVSCYRVWAAARVRRLAFRKTA